MPLIHYDQRLQIDGGQTPALTMRKSFQVDFTEQFTLDVPAAAIESASASADKAKAKAGKQESKMQNPGRVVYKLPLSKLKFAAIFVNGQGNGLRVGIGNAKRMDPLDQPVLYLAGDVRRFGTKPTITLENDLTLQRNVVLLVGSDLDKGSRKVVTIKKMASKNKRLKKNNKKSKP